VFDSHCHLDLPVFEHDRPAVLARAAAAGVTAILVPAIRPATFARLRAVVDAGAGTGAAAATAGLTAAAPALHLALGVHPQVVPELDAEERRLALDPEAIAAAAVAAGAVAIGECGLDGATADPALQERVFRAHIRAARAARLPLVIHVLRAHGLAPRVLAEEGVAGVGGVLHSYSGGAELVPAYRDLGLCFSLAGPVTYRNAKRPVEAARAIPDDRLLAETDAPDQSPEPHRGQRCEPAFVAAVVDGLARARGSTAAAIAALTSANAQRLFRRAGAQRGSLATTTTDS
jgi:TatD DNase family protein